MGLIRILPMTAVLVILTSAATFGHGPGGILLDQQGRELSGKDQSDLAEWETLNQQARDFSKKGQYDLAVAAGEKALEISKQSAYLNEAGAVGISLCSLAIGYYNQAKYVQAEPLYKRALEIDEKVLGPDHPNVAVALKNLAGIYRITHRDVDAAKLEQRAASIEAIKR